MKKRERERKNVREIQKEKGSNSCSKTSTVIINSTNQNEYYVFHAHLWWGGTNSSPAAATNIVGMKHLSACSIGDSCLISKAAVFNTLPLIILMAILTMKEGAMRPLWRPFSTISSASIWRSANALSKIIPAMDGSLSPCSSAVAAPMLLPHRAMVEVVPECLKCSITLYQKSSK